ncbi:MAG: hypothetical protein Q8K64_15595 [Sediminibacterium sp.]|nr:hypothetical protein [Sediminibacterium sp.]
MQIEFSSKDLFTWLESQGNSSYDELPFGVVKMDKNSTVIYYNNQESRITGVNPEMAKGKNFFVQIAPCTNNFMVAEKYKLAELDEELDYLFTYVTTPTKVRLRLLKSAAHLHQYMVVHKY